MALTEDEQKLIYNLYINEKKGIDSYQNGFNKNMINRLHRLNLLRKCKLRGQNKNIIKLTDEGFVVAVIICRIKGEFNFNHSISVLYW